MDGFSDLVSDLGSLEVGHLLGLRWFQLTEEPDPGAVAETDAAEAQMLRQRRLAVWNQCKRLADKVAVEERRAFTPSEQALWDGWNAMMDVLDSKLAGRRYCMPKVLTMRGSRGPWQPGENEATCITTARPYTDGPKAHIVPVSGCGCGFWAYWELGPKMVGAPAVAGLIKGYGRTIEGSKGFRCSHASIEAVWMPTWDDAVALELERRYQVPVYCKMGALLRLHKAPEGQRPLADAWSGSSEGRVFFYGHAAAPQRDTSARSPMPGVHYYTDSAMDTYRAMTGQTGPIDQALPCKMCGDRKCGPGQDMCLRCEIRHGAAGTFAPSAVTFAPGGAVVTSTSVNMTTFGGGAAGNGSFHVAAAGGSGGVTGGGGAGGAGGGGGVYSAVGGPVSATFTSSTDALKAVVASIAGQIAARYGPAKDSGAAAPAPADSDPPPATPAA